MEVYRIIIADDHDIVRSGLELILSKEPEMELTAMASSYEELTELLDGSVDADLLILDLNLGDRNGLGAIRELRERFDSLPILVLSMYPEELYALQAIRAGASGYLNKRAISGELVAAIHKVLSGEKYISREVEEELLFGTSLEEERSAREILSERELQVLSLLAAGKNATEIGEHLSISPKTVSTYRARMLEKLDLENTAQLIQYALQNNIVA
jgi:DNA-binding NarL/FixJ family response regulator